MAKTHFILVGFGDLGTRIFPTLLQINDEESKKLPTEQNLLDISIVDFLSLDEIIGRVKSKYLFSWDDVPENDNGILIEFFTQKFGIDWVKTAKIEKINDGRTIKISTEKNNLSLRLNDEKTKVNLEIDNDRIDEFIAKIENGKLNIYKSKLDKRFKSYSVIPYDESKHLDLLRKYYFQDDRDSKLIPKDLITKIRPERTIVYLAIPPDNYLSTLEKYLPFGNIFAIEKPLATDSKKAGELVDFARTNFEFFGKRFIPVDHYLGKYSVNLLNRITKIRQLGAIIDDTNLITFSFLEENIDDPHERPYFPKTGIIADMMPHVLALLKKILNRRFEVEPKQIKVITSVLDSYEEQCQMAGIFSTYLFSWDDVPENDNGRLIEFLTQKFGIEWVKTAKIEKINDGRTIKVSDDNNSLLLELNNEKTKVNLKIDDYRIHKFLTKTENGKLNIYSSTKETYAEIELILSQESGSGPTITAVIRIGKAVGLEDRTVTFVNSTRDMLRMTLPNPKLKEGEVLLKSVVGGVKIEDVELPRDDWDKAWYNIIRFLMDNTFSEFLTMEDAQKIVETIENIKKVNQ